MSLADTSSDKGADPVIVVEDLRKRYGDIQAVDGISFEVQRGEVFALLGPNGSGKTTTVEIIEGMRSADSGRATVAGIDVGRNPKAVKQHIGVQLQSSAFFEHLNLAELLRMLGSIYRVKVDPDPLLEAVDLGERKSASFRTLSGGQKQRFAIAASLVNDPDVVFLDEPTTGLDPQARALDLGLGQDLEAGRAHRGADDALHGGGRGTVRPGGGNGQRENHRHGVAGPIDRPADFPGVPPGSMKCGWQRWRTCSLT